MSEPTRITAKIPLPPEAKIISDLIKGEDASLYVVGGAVRDWLYCKFHKPTELFKAKDFDFATNLSEEEIVNRLQSQKAKKLFVTVKEKESVDTFGVVFVSVNGNGPYEIAPFRKDIGSTDGRHPDRIERGNIEDDAARRDLTINSLYYDIDKNQIIDFNPDGQGIKDIKSGHVRTVGDPEKRFEEDKLRILRMIRFFSRYNSGKIIDFIDQKTIEAIEKYKRLMEFKGMSYERIQTEFLLGIQQCKDVSAYIENYLDLDLFPTIFPDCKISHDAIKILKEYKLNNKNVVLALLLRENSEVKEKLNQFKYPNSISGMVQFLINSIVFDPNDAVDLIKLRDKKLIKGRELTDAEHCINSNTRSEINECLNSLCLLLNQLDEKRCLILEHLRSFYYEPTSGEELMAKGLVGPEIGQKQRQEIQSEYKKSLDVFLKSKGLQDA